MTDSAHVLLSTRLSVSYQGKPCVLRDIALDVRRGEILGLVGQSGSGKSTLALAILGLLDGKRAKTEGSVEFQGRDLLKLPERDLRKIRGRTASSWTPRDGPGSTSSARTRSERSYLLPGS